MEQSDIIIKNQFSSHFSILYELTSLDQQNRFRMSTSLIEISITADNSLIELNELEKFDLLI